MYGQDLLEVIKQAGKSQADARMSACSGWITSVDPAKYMAKVMLEPMGIETGWLPIGTLYAGSGFGLWALPEIHTEVTVLFEMGNLNTGKIMLCHFNGTDAPPGLSPGDVALVHKTGSTLKFHTDGSVILNPVGNLILANGSNGVARVGDSVSVNVNGTIYSGTITSGSGKIKG